MKSVIASKNKTIYVLSKASDGPLMQDNIRMERRRQPRILPHPVGNKKMEHILLKSDGPKNRQLAAQPETNKSREKAFLLLASSIDDDVATHLDLNSIQQICNILKALVPYRR